MAIELTPEIDPEVSRMLDEGCPNGDLSFQAKRVGRGVLDGVIGLDNSKDALRGIHDQGTQQSGFSGESLEPSR